MELATTFLLASIDKYLKDDARWLCVMPGSILSGYNHDPLRLEKYRDSVNSVATNIDTIWELPISTFKNKAVVLGGLGQIKSLIIRFREDCMKNLMYIQIASIRLISREIDQHGQIKEKALSFWILLILIHGNSIKVRILCQEQRCFMSLHNYQMAHGQ